MSVVPGGATPDRVYADYGGFAPVDPRVLAVMRPFFEGVIGNPSSPHSLGSEARESLDAARVKVGRLIGGAAAGVVFTSGATESNNLAIKGVAVRGRGRAPSFTLSSVICSFGSPGSTVVRACLSEDSPEGFFSPDNP